MTRTCDHCSLEFDEKIFIIEGGKYFCCKGCQGVYHLLKYENLDSFYSKKGNTSLKRVESKLTNLAKFDTDIFQNKYLVQLKFC